MSDKITPEGLRNSADYTEALVVQCGHELVTVKALEHMDQLRAHADALEELAALREQLAGRDAEIAKLARTVGLLGVERSERDAAMLGLVAAKNEAEQIIEKQEAEIVALKGHAEALAGHVKAFSERTAYYHEDDSMGYLVCCSGRFGHDPNCEAINALNSYRAAYPKED